MFISKRAVAAAVAIGAVTALSGCANNLAAEMGAATELEATAARASYDALVADIYGTPVQRIAGEERGWLRTQAAISTCAKEAGVTYPIGPFNAMTSPDRQVAPGDLLGFAPIGTTMGVGEFKKRWAAKGGPQQENNPVYLALKTEAEQASYMKVIEGCQGAATKHEASYRTPSADQLSAKFIGVLAKIMQQATPNAGRDYVACMQTAGVPVESYSDLALKVRKAYPPIVYDKPKDATAEPGWAQAAAFEAKAATADAACRKDIAATAMAAAQPALATFAAENHTDLDRNAAQWTSIEAEVVALRAQIAKN